MFCKERLSTSVKLFFKTHLIHSSNWKLGFFLRFPESRSHSENRIKSDQITLRSFLHRKNDGQGKTRQRTRLLQNKTKQNKTKSAMATTIKKEEETIIAKTYKKRQRKKPPILIVPPSPSGLVKRDVKKAGVCCGVSLTTTILLQPLSQSLPPSPLFLQRCHGLQGPEQRLLTSKYVQSQSPCIFYSILEVKNWLALVSFMWLEIFFYYIFFISV